MCQRRVNVHGLTALDDLLGRSLVLHGPHIVQTVSDLDQHHTDILGHGHEHLAQILHLCLLRGGEIGTGQLGNTFHQLGNRSTELLFNIIVGGIGILNTVMQQRTQHRIHIQTHLHHDLCHRQGVDDIGRSVLTLLILMLGVGIFDCPFDLVHVRTGHASDQRADQRFIMFRKSFHVY